MRKKGHLQLGYKEGGKRNGQRKAKATAKKVVIQRASRNKRLRLTRGSGRSVKG